MTLRAVLDTNVIVSGLGWRGAPAAVLDAVLDGRVTLVTSPPLLAELRRVLLYPKLARVIEGGGKLADLVEASGVVVLSSRVFAVVGDESDNRVLEAAVEGAADYIVSGDEDLLGLGSFQGIAVETPRDFFGSRERTVALSGIRAPAFCGCHEPACGLGGPRSSRGFGRGGGRWPRTTGAGRNALAGLSGLAYCDRAVGQFSRLIWCLPVYSPTRHLGA
ncbi:MAG: putative toxin-antitoxin system toxin component, PIN family [Actinomycetota bacterium]|nr:putative toxin-antitoxin system toxin component, PIN family [Actinomycetota bacterium]